MKYKVGTLPQRVIQKGMYLISVIFMDILQQAVVNKLQGLIVTNVL
ncbi:MAG: hypothetical protein V5A83_04325 [Candidatus Bipolaricaulota bacterium]